MLVHLVNLSPNSNPEIPNTMTALSEAEVTQESQKAMIARVAHMIATEPRGVLFIINKKGDHFSLTIDRVKDGERESLLDDENEVTNRHDLIQLTLMIIQQAMTIQYNKKQHIRPEAGICVTDMTRVNHKLEMSSEAQLKFYH